MDPNDQNDGDEPEPNADLEAFDNELLRLLPIPNNNNNNNNANANNHNNFNQGFRARLARIYNRLNLIDMEIDNIRDEFAEVEYDNMNEVEDDDDDDNDDDVVVDDDIEEVADTDYDDDNHDMNAEESETNYDLSLPIEHSYLGSLDTINSTKYLYQPGSIIQLKTLYFNGMYLIPGQEIPLTFSTQVTLRFIRTIIENDDTRTFGLRIGRLEDRFGTTAEIRSYVFKDNNSSITIKILGRQRFTILEDHSNDQCEYQPSVKILPEIDLHDFYRTLIKSEHRLASKNCRLLSSLPFNTSNYYDNHTLMEQLKQILIGIFEHRIKNDNFNFPGDAIAFSYFVMMTIPFPDCIKTKLLKMDCVNLRLRFELELLNNNFKFICGTCGEKLCDRNSFLIMSKSGTSGTFVNTHGIVHELYTFFKVENIRRVSSYSEDFSWFPNYGWIIINCRNCHTHLGWEFETLKPNISPKKFFALTKNSIRLKFENIDSDESNAVRRVIVNLIQ